MDSRKSIFIVLVSITIFIPGLTEADTLQQLLIKDNIRHDQVAIKNLEREIHGYSILNDPNYFCAAYYLYDDPNLWNRQFYFVLLDKGQDKWIQRTLELKEIRGDKPYLWPNSINNINYSKKYFYLDTHLTPSAGYLILLHKDLSFADGLYGWLEAVFTEDSIIYHNSQVHFAPTHYAELSLYNISTKVDRKIYPMKPYLQVRLSHISKVKAAYERKGEDWFRIHNHHMNPELFNNSIASNVIVNNQTRSFAFVVKYDNTDYMSDEAVLKLKGFSELRQRLKQKKIENPLSNELFTSLHDDLMKAKRIGNPESVIDLFNENVELKAMVTAVLKSEDNRYDINWKQDMISMDANWDNLEVWNQLAITIHAKEENYTEVLYIYRQDNKTDKLDYKEILLEEAKRVYGDVPLSKYLESDLLQRIFDN